MRKILLGVWRTKLSPVVIWKTETVPNKLDDLAKISSKRNKVIFEKWTISLMEFRGNVKFQGGIL